MADYYGEDLLNLLSSQLMEIYIERDGTKIFYGVLSKMEISPLKDGSRSLTLEAVSWIGLFTKRIVGIPYTHYTATDAGQIAWDLIDDSQNSDSPYSDWGIPKAPLIPVSTVTVFIGLTAFIIRS